MGDILLQGRIVVFVNQNRRRGVRNEKKACSTLRSGVGNSFLHKTRDVLEIHPRVSFNINSLQPRRSSR